MSTTPRKETRREAAKGGRVHYLTKPCAVCGDPHRYTSSAQCVTCTKERANTYTESVRQDLREAKQ